MRMEISSGLTIAVDAGHGGADAGAQYENRREKDDNLRLARAVRRELAAQGADVLMIRNSDIHVTPEDRVRIANEAGADLFISLHRAADSGQGSGQNGVGGFIYLTAQVHTSGAAAEIILNQVAGTGVQGNRGVSRGNYYVLRKAAMPALLLEMGSIADDEDNRLFEEKLQDYAAAIAKGALLYFGEEYRPEALGVLPPKMAGRVPSAQESLAREYEIAVPQTGLYDSATRRAATEALQFELNDLYDAGIPEDGVFTLQTRDAVRSLREGDEGSLVRLLQMVLALNGYGPGEFNGLFAASTYMAVQMFQRDHYLVPDGVAGRDTWGALLGFRYDDAPRAGNL